VKVILSSFIFEITRKEKKNINLNVLGIRERIFPKKYKIAQFFSTEKKE
jgi:hypothetical protein